MALNHSISKRTQYPAVLSRTRILKTWWPLAASWVLMGMEGPAISAVISRLPEPKIHLAAYGGLLFPLALLIEAPIIMMLAASTALSRDWSSFLKLRRFMLRLGGVLTILHIIMVTTPAYSLIARNVIGAPEEIVGPARLGLLIMIPWTWAIAYRRFYQGVLIRFGHSFTVGLGTGVRLSAEILVLSVTYAIGGVQGIVVGACTLVAGVLTEALFAHLTVQKTLRNELRTAPLVDRTLTTRAMLRFYVPLSLTQLLVLVGSPLGSAAMSRMPAALESLAAWPVVNGVNYLVRSFGGAYNEVVVALVEEPRSTRPLRRFALLLGLAATAIPAFLLIPPVNRAVFEGLLDLADPLPGLAATSLFFLLPLPAAAVAQSYFQGVILFSRRTRGVTESVALFLVVTALVLLGGVLWGGMTGLYLAIGAFLTGELSRTAWLWLRSRGARSGLRQRDAA